MHVNPQSNHLHPSVLPQATSTENNIQKHIYTNTFLAWDWALIFINHKLRWYLKELGMCDTSAEDDPKMTEGAGLVSGSQLTASVSSPETAEVTQTEEALPGATLTLYSPLQKLHRPCCLVLVLILLVLSLLFSWAVVHLSFGTRSKPFRISSSYNQPGNIETATYDSRFTTNCTIGECLTCCHLFYILSLHGAKT